MTVLFPRSPYLASLLVHCLPQPRSNLHPAEPVVFPFICQDHYCYWLDMGFFSALLQIKSIPSLSIKLLVFSHCLSLVGWAGVENNSNSRQKAINSHCSNAKFLSFSRVIASQIDVCLLPVSKAVKWLYLTSLSSFIIALGSAKLHLPPYWKFWPQYTWCLQKELQILCNIKVQFLPIN